MSFRFQESDTQFVFPDFLTAFDLDAEMCHELSATAHEPQTTPRVRTKGKKRDPEATPEKRMRVKTPRLRDKAKIELLRREIESLETELQIRSQSQHRATPAPTEEPMWQSVAMTQRQERQLAEHRNKRLKRMLSAQQLLTASLSSVLSEWEDLQGSLPASSTEHKFH